jgi:hypothetical protein
MSFVFDYISIEKQSAYMDKLDRYENKENRNDKMIKHYSSSVELMNQQIKQSTKTIDDYNNAIDREENKVVENSEISFIKSLSSTPSPRCRKSSVKPTVTELFNSLDDSGDDDIQVLGKEFSNKLITQLEKASTILMNVSKSNVTSAQEEELIQM